MKHYVDRHAVYPSDSARLIPNLVLKANQKRGNYLQVESRLKNLAEQLKEISLASGLGWDVYLDEEARQFVFDVQAGKNLTRNQQTYPPVIFSTSLENVLEREFEKIHPVIKTQRMLVGRVKVRIDELLRRIQKQQLDLLVKKCSSMLEI